MSNPHHVSVQDLHETDPQWALVEATLLLAHEARTANLIALSEIQGESVNGRATLTQIASRLGLGDTK